MQPGQEYNAQSDQPTPQSTAGFSLAPAQPAQLASQAPLPQAAANPHPVSADTAQAPLPVAAVQFGQAAPSQAQSADVLQDGGTPDGSNMDEIDEGYDEAQEEAAAADDHLLAWQNQQQTGAHRTSQWYIIMGIIAAGSIVAAILLQSWFFIPLGVLVPIALTKYGSKGADAHSYELTTFGVTVDGKHYPYDNYKSFFEIDNQGHPTFELVPLKRFATLLTLHGTPEVADDIVEILGSVLPESEPEGYLGESILKRLKF